MLTSAFQPSSLVNSYNEWDPLEEVIVGAVDGANVPPWHLAVKAVLTEKQCEFFLKNQESPFPAAQIAAARKELDEFVHVLEGEGVKVRRPEPIDHSQRYGTARWTSSGLYAAMPRDILLVVGNEIIECPLAWRSRYYEVSAYRALLKDYFRSGAKWSAAPKPELVDAQYDGEWSDAPQGEPSRFIITEFEPTFDAADFIRCGRDIIAQKSNVTNEFGIDWLRRHLGSAYRIHVLQFHDNHPMHIDATLLPLAPGKVLVNPERVLDIPYLFKNWDVLPAPLPSILWDQPLYMTTKWINMNILMLDEQRVIVERHEESMIAALKTWGFKPIPCNFRAFNAFGGSFHCATLDIRRRGELRSYF